LPGSTHDALVDDDATTDIFEALFDIRSDTQEILRLLREDDDEEQEEES
jgi:hypothetical protein